MYLIIRSAAQAAQIKTKGAAAKQNNNNKFLEKWILKK